MRIEYPLQAMQQNILDRFLRYVRIDTQSSTTTRTIPSTKRQLTLARILKNEIETFGLPVTLSQKGYVVARKKGNTEAPPVAFFAHLDTATELSGKNVSPQLWHNYNGTPIIIGKEYVLDPAEHEDLMSYLNDTIITTDGSTLLGADDKAGIAEVMTALQFLTEHPDFPHGDLEIIFNPDEEVGRGIDGLDMNSLAAKFAITIDGKGDGKINTSCFNAYALEIKFSGRIIHPGYARHKLINAVSMASRFLTLLPSLESPEATDGVDGYYYPYSVSGGPDMCTVHMLIRDYEIQTLRKRIDTVNMLARAIKASYPGSNISVKEHKQYLNMHRTLKNVPYFAEILMEAIRQTGIEPSEEAIRGGCDGSLLCETGLPTINLFSGSQAAHSRYEWIALSSMLRACQSILNFLRLWTEWEHQ